MNNKTSPVFLVTFSDLWNICKSSKRYIFLGILLAGLLGLLYALSRPVEFVAQGSFREKGKTATGIPGGNLLSYLTPGASTANSEASATLKSRTILLALIHKLNLQGTIAKRSFEFVWVKNLQNNLITEYSRYHDLIGPYFNDITPALSLSNIAYTNESPLGFRVRFLDDATFQIINDDEAPHGKLDEPYSYKSSTFTISRNGIESVLDEEFNISLLPIDYVVKTITAKISIESDKEDKNLLRIKYKDADRFQAAKIINTIMNLYQDYLWNEQQLIMNKQVAYLYTRHDEVTERLRSMMNQHAENLSLDVATTGFPDTASAMAFLAGTQQQYARELLAIELEVKRLEQIQSEDTLQYLKATSDNAFTAFNQTLNNIHDLKKQADTLDIALREVASRDSDTDFLVPNLTSQLNALNEQKELYLDASNLLAKLENGKIPDTSYRLMQDPKYKVKGWYDNLINCKENSAERANCLRYFTAYITNLQRLFQVHSIAIEEQLTHQQQLVNEYQGIDLKTAETLYINYNNDLNKVEALIKQLKFIVDRIGEPEFEISSLSNFLEDPVSNKMISDASALVLSMRDHENRSLKELERVKHELDLQKGFLLVHLNQTTQLHQLKKELIEKKINSLQHATLALVRQEISVLDQHLRDHIIARINNLKQEQTVLESHQQQVQKEMALLPQKWVNEKIIDQQMELNKKMVEEVAKLVESKNIARNLELIQSAPLDAAVAPTHPQPTRTFLFMLVGAILGGMLSSTLAIVYQAFKGIPITSANLRAAGYQVLGTFTKDYLPGNTELMRDQDLALLRRMVNYLTVEPPPQATLLVVNDEIDYSTDLANLIQKRGFKVVLLPISSQSNEQERRIPPEANGLFQYLEGKVSFPAIASINGIDQILTGGFSRFSQELVCSDRFNELVEKLLERYDYVVMVTHAAPISPEVHALTKLVSYGVISVKQETIADLQGMSHLNNFSFVFGLTHT